jgi:hypothetical protein
VLKSSKISNSLRGVSRVAKSLGKLLFTFGYLREINTWTSLLRRL